MSYQPFFWHNGLYLLPSKISPVLLFGSATVYTWNVLVNYQQHVFHSEWHSIQDIFCMLFLWNNTSNILGIMDIIVEWLTYFKSVDIKILKWVVQPFHLYSNLHLSKMLTPLVKLRLAYSFPFVIAALELEVVVSFYHFLLYRYYLIVLKVLNGTCTVTFCISLVSAVVKNYQLKNIGIISSAWYFNI